jgi:hypothetical protein
VGLEIILGPRGAGTGSAAQKAFEEASKEFILLTPCKQYAASHHSLRSRTILLEGVVRPRHETFLRSAG